MSMKFLKSAASFWKKVSGNVVVKDTSAAVGIGGGQPADYSYANDLLINSVNANNYGGITIKGSDGVDVNGMRFATSTGSGSSTYKGFVQYSHIDNSMSFGTSSLSRLKIDSDGAITASAQPAFSATNASSQDNIATGSVVTIVLGTEVFDQGADFATNTFTAPVTGRYQFSLTARIDSLDTAATYYQIGIITSNRTYSQMMSPAQFAADVAIWNFSLAILTDMDASDTAYAFIVQSGGTAQTDIPGAEGVYFTGHLVC